MKAQKIAGLLFLGTYFVTFTLMLCGVMPHFLVEPSLLFGTAGFLAIDSGLLKLPEKKPRQRPAKQLSARSAPYGLPVITPLQKGVQLPVVAGPPVTARARKAAEYVPAGQQELTASLFDYMTEQVSEARRTPFTAGRKREWHVSPEWLEQVRLVRGVSGTAVFVPRMRSAADRAEGTAFGYPVVVADHFGIPELTAV